MDAAALQQAYQRTAWHRLGIPFAQAVALPGVRTALEASARRSQPKAATATARRS